MLPNILEHMILVVNGRFQQYPISQMKITLIRDSHYYNYNTKSKVM